MHTAKKIFKDLIKLGVTPRKSLTLKFPTFLNEDLMRHFIRGYFDGDGCIWDGKRQKRIVKDKTVKLGYREKTVHNVKFTFTGNDSFISDLQKYLVNKIGINICKLNYSKAKNSNTTTSKNVCTMEYCGRGNIKNCINICIMTLLFMGRENSTSLIKLFVLLMRNHHAKQG